MYKPKITRLKFNRDMKDGLYRKMLDLGADDIMDGSFKMIDGSLYCTIAYNYKKFSLS